MKTAIIDYGIDSDTLSRYKNQTENLTVSEGKVIPAKPPEQFTHGGLCAGVFAAQAGVLPDVSICLDRDNSCKSAKDDLCAALKWCLYNGIALINLSMGTTQPCDALELRKITDELCDKGSVLIAAANNSGFITYPASFGSCIGVACDDGITDGFIYIKNPFDGIDAVTYKIKLPGFQFDKSNSLSAAFVSGMICKETNSAINIESVRRLLSEKSKKTDNKREADYLKAKTAGALCPETINIVCLRRAAKQAETFINEMRKHITNDGYICAVLLRNGDNIPSDFRFALKASTMTMFDTFDFIAKFCRPNIILCDAPDLAYLADVLAYDDMKSYQTGAALIYRINEIAPSELWLKTKGFFE